MDLKTDNEEMQKHIADIEAVMVESDDVVELYILRELHMPDVLLHSKNILDVDAFTLWADDFRGRIDLKIIRLFGTLTLEMKRELRSILEMLQNDEPTEEEPNPEGKVIPFPKEKK